MGVRLPHVGILTLVAAACGLWASFFPWLPRLHIVGILGQVAGASVVWVSFLQWLRLSPVGIISRVAAPTSYGRPVSHGCRLGGLGVLSLLARLYTVGILLSLARLPPVGILGAMAAPSTIGNPSFVGCAYPLWASWTRWLRLR